MKLHERINCILLGTLWTLAIVLVLDFWLNTVYNFNIFSNAHWQFVASLQASNQHIASGFYISIIFAVLLCISGLYMILRPKFRKIMPAAPKKIEEPAPVVVPESRSSVSAPQPTMQQPTMQRPPHLHIQLSQKNTPPRQPEVKPVQQPTGPRYTQEMQKIFEDAGYRVLEAKTISGVPLSLIALGTNESLWLGAYEISHEQMLDTMIKFKSIFQETLDDIDIDINAFIIKPTDDKTVDAILDFDSVDNLATVIADNPNAEESAEDKESGNMDAFAGYIETVLTYLGNK